MSLRATFHALVAVLTLGGVARAGESRPGESKPGESKPKIGGPADVGACFEKWSPDDCVQALKAYVGRQPGQAFEVGRALTSATSHWVAAPFFEKALATRGDSARCADPKVALAVISALGLPDDHGDNKAVAAARNVVTVRCWNELGPAITRAVEADGGYLVDNVCPILRARKKESPACKVTSPAPAPAKAAATAEPWEALDPHRIDLDGAAKVYLGAEGRRVTLAKVKGRPYHLIKFEGFRGPWNGRVIVHRERQTDNGFDYWTPVNGAEFISFVVRDGGGGYAQHQAYLQGDKGPFDVSYDADASKAASTKALLSDFGKR